MSQETTCPDCRGTGTNHVLVNMGGFCEHRTMTCSNCRGKGAIPDNLLSWAAQGEAMKQDRLERRLSLKTEAERLGIHQTELYQMEHGTIRPFDYEELKIHMGAAPGALKMQQ